MYPPSENSTTRIAIFTIVSVVGHCILKSRWRRSLMKAKEAKQHVSTQCPWVWSQRKNVPAVCYPKFLLYLFGSKIRNLLRIFQEPDQWSSKHFLSCIIHLFSQLCVMAIFMIEMGWTKLYISSTINIWEKGAHQSHFCCTVNKYKAIIGTL